MSGKLSLRPRNLYALLRGEASRRHDRACQTLVLSHGAYSLDFGNFARNNPKEDVEKPYSTGCASASQQHKHVTAKQRVPQPSNEVPRRTVVQGSTEATLQLTGPGPQCQQSYIASPSVHILSIQNSKEHQSPRIPGAGGAEDREYVTCPTTTFLLPVIQIPDAAAHTAPFRIP